MFSIFFVSKNKKQLLKTTIKQVLRNSFKVRACLKTIFENMFLFFKTKNTENKFNNQKLLSVLKNQKLFYVFKNKKQGVFKYFFFCFQLFF